MLDFYVDPRGITVFSKTTCPYCVKAVQLLNDYQVGLQTYELDNISNGQQIANNLKNKLDVLLYQIFSCMGKTLVVTKN